MPKLQQVSAKKTEHVPACPLLQIENTSEVHLQWVQLSEYSPFVSIIFFYIWTIATNDKFADRLDRKCNEKTCIHLPQGEHKKANKSLDIIC